MLITVLRNVKSNIGYASPCRGVYHEGKRMKQQFYWKGVEYEKKKSFCVFLLFCTFECFI